MATNASEYFEFIRVRHQIKHESRVGYQSLFIMFPENSCKQCLANLIFAFSYD
jgi:hypothetical protein